MARRLLSFSKRYAFATVILAAASGAPRLSRQPLYDILIKGGRVLDGTGNPWFPADIGIRNGKIAAIGDLSDGPAARTVDASGHYVAPGFIDIHSHADAGLGKRATNTNLNMVTQGVTMVVVNQDGRSSWPISQQRTAYETRRIGTNVVLLVGHGTVRSIVMKNDFKRAATQSEIEEMKTLVRQGMNDGAFGLSAGLEYVPGRWSTTNELIELAKAIAPYGGFFISHQRSEGHDPMWKNASDPSPPISLAEAVRETIRVGESAGIAVIASHLKVKGVLSWGSSHAVTRLITEARGRGVQVYADQHPYNSSGSDGETLLIPMWALADEGIDVGGQLAELMRGRMGTFARMKKNFVRRLEDTATRAKIREDIAHEIDRRGGPEGIMIDEFPDPGFAGKSLARVARLRREDPVDTAIWIQLNGLNRPGGARMRGFSMAETDIEQIMKQEFTATCADAPTVALGDGLSHPRSYGAFPRKIRTYVFDRKIISLPFAIRSMTSLPAQIMRLQDRGLLKENYWADIVIFDPEKITDRASYANPHQFAEGIPHVLVNGDLVVDNGKPTGRLPGKVLTPTTRHH
ncbi:MAG: D-aminoacylase [Acidobacteria bacterium]|nr:D-aminoacylase [Acidobacteriota bacterium]